MTQVRDESGRARILAGAQRPFSELLPGLGEARAELDRALEGVSELQAAFRPPSGEGEDAWGVAEVLRHLIQAEEGQAVRIGRLARGDPAESSVPGRLGEHEGATLCALLRSYGSAHERLVEVVSGLGGQERLDTMAAHSMFGDLNCRGWLVMYTGHLWSHARQISGVKAGAGVPGGVACGWAS